MTSVQSGTTAAVNSPPMAVYPLNSSSKLDQEPNPFEQSFATNVTGSTPSSGNSSNNSQHQKDSLPKLPPVAALDSPAGVMNALPKDVASQFQWDSLRRGPLSPSMLTGPTRQQQQQQQQQQYDYNSNNATSHMTQSSNNYGDRSAYNAKRKADDNSSSSQSPVQGTTSADNLQQQSPSPEPDSKPKQQSRKKARPKTAEDEEKRRNFLERNRIAALKCRQRKKQWLNNLQNKVEVLTNENEQLQMQVETMREEIMNLKTLLLAHKDCPAAQNNGFNGSIPKGMPVMHQQGIRATGPSNGGPPPPPPNAVYSQPFSAADRSQTTSAPMNAPPQQPHHFQQQPPPPQAAAMVGMPMQPPQSHPVQQQGMMAGASGPSTGVIRL
ncbi:bzip transcription factor [Lichtheimia corymbifera JMRC:FSU:9682]|uniref:Bzip transcription factor n=1 Tax=Lichtheimia corymbifera JMRC:FSU:9682 TaxID=1263082 RepID=A0A068RP58_9FUNG|nr:bzip transcription factor [Lichtheimia corymbifera JMRC:FSU:9682]